MRIQSYDDQLLHLAADLAQRLLPAFDTPTGLLRCLLITLWTHTCFFETMEYLNMLCIISEI